MEKEPKYEPWLRQLIHDRTNEALDIISDRREVTAIARRYGISRSSMYNLRNIDYMPSALTLIALADSGLSVDYMLGITDDKGI